VRLDGDLFDVVVELLDQDELQPGETAAVAVSFLSPDLVHSLVRVGDTYGVFEGSREIGSLLVEADVWRDPARLVRVGEEYAAKVTEIGWTTAGVVLDNGWTATLNSRDVGLAPWAEIGEALREGQHLRVRVESIDPITRAVTLSLQPPRLSGRGHG